MVTGKDGVVSNIVRRSLDDAGGKIDVPSNLVNAEDLTGYFTALKPQDINSLSARLGKAAPGSTIMGKDANALFDFQKTLEKEAWDTLSRNISDSKAIEFAQAKLLFANRIEGVLDDAISKAGTSSQLAQDPAIITFLAKNVSDNFAKRFAETGGDLRMLRSLQKDYYRMGQIAELAQQENSSLGRAMFGWLNNIPAVGATLSALSKQGEAYLGTGVPVAMQNMGKAANAVGSGVSQAVGNTVQRMAPIMGSAAAVEGLGAVPPQL